MKFYRSSPFCFRHYWKNSPRRGTCYGECRKRLVCDARSGRSHDRRALCGHIEARIDGAQPTPQTWRAWLYNGLSVSWVLLCKLTTALYLRLTLLMLYSSIFGTKTSQTRIVPTSLGLAIKLNEWKWVHHWARNRRKGTVYREALSLKFVTSKMRWTNLYRDRHSKSSVSIINYVLYWE